MAVSVVFPLTPFAPLYLLPAMFFLFVLPMYYLESNLNNKPTPVANDQFASKPEEQTVVEPPAVGSTNPQQQPGSAGAPRRLPTPTSDFAVEGIRFQPAAQGESRASIAAP